MKKFVIISIALFISFTVTGKGKVGIVGGYTSTRMSLSEEIKSWDIKSAPGYHIGVTCNWQLPLGFGVQPQLMYSSKSSEIAGLMKNKVSYIEVPVQLQWGIDLIILKPYIFVEPFAGFAISDVMQGLNSSFKLDAKKGGRFEYGLSIGAGVMVARHVQVSFKYFWNQDCTDFSEFVIPDMNLSTIQKRLNGLAISAGVFF